jgi:hypothetical protein
VKEFKTLKKETERIQKVEIIIQEFMRIDSLFELNINQALVKEVISKTNENPIPDEIFDNVHTNIMLLLSEILRSFSKSSDLDQEEETKTEGREDKILGMFSISRKAKSSFSEESQKRAQTDRSPNEKSSSVIKFFKFSRDELDKSRQNSRDEEFLRVIKEVESTDETSEPATPKEPKNMSLLEMLREEEEEEVKEKHSTFRQLFKPVSPTPKAKESSPRPQTDRTKNPRFIEVWKEERKGSLTPPLNGNSAPKEKRFKELQETQDVQPLSLLEVLKESNEPNHSTETKKSKTHFLDMIKEEQDKKKKLKPENSSDGEFNLSSPNSVDQVQGNPISVSERIQLEEQENERNMFSKKQYKTSGNLRRDRRKLSIETTEVSQTERSQGSGKVREGFLEHLKNEYSKTKDSKETNPEPSLEKHESTLGFLEMLQEESQKEMLTSPKNDKPLSFLEMLQGDDEESEEPNPQETQTKKRAKSEKSKKPKVIPKEKPDKQLLSPKESTLGFLEMLKDSPKESSNKIPKTPTEEKPLSFLEMLQGPEETEMETKKLENKTKKSDLPFGLKLRDPIRAIGRKQSSTEDVQPKKRRSLADLFKIDKPKPVEPNDKSKPRNMTPINETIDNPIETLKEEEEDDESGESKSRSMSLSEILKEEPKSNKPMSLLEMLKEPDSLEEEEPKTPEKSSNIKNIFKTLKKKTETKKSKPIEEPGKLKELEDVAVQDVQSKLEKKDVKINQKVDPEENPFEKLAREKSKVKNSVEVLTIEKKEEIEVKKEEEEERKTDETLVQESPQTPSLIHEEIVNYELKSNEDFEESKPNVTIPMLSLGNTEDSKTTDLSSILEKSKKSHSMKSTKDLSDFYEKETESARNRREYTPDLTKMKMVNPRKSQRKLTLKKPTEEPIQLEALD